METVEQSTKPLSGRPDAPKRRRIWWLLIPIFLLALAIPPAIPRKPDGLDFIRKHRPVSEVLSSVKFQHTSRGAMSEITVWHREFKFKAITLDLLMDIQPGKEPGTTSSWQTSMLPDGSVVTWDLEKSTVNVQLGQEPPWLIRQWNSLMNRFSPSSRPVPIHVIPHP